ncbi:MAG TPA: YncE family protein, partial [Geminicoccaceae bacterium]|nr:YncE family protein [Geminicoccaceae bacterium]
MAKERIKRERTRGARCGKSGPLLLAALAAVGGAAVAAEPETEAVYNQATHSSPIALSLDQRLVWVVNPGDDSVSVLRTDTNTVLTKIKVGDEPQSVALDPNNRFAVVANAAGSSLSVIGILNAKYGSFKAVVLGAVKTGAEPWNVVVSPDGKRVFVANSGQDTITV